MDIMELVFSSSTPTTSKETPLRTTVWPTQSV